MHPAPSEFEPPFHAQQRRAPEWHCFSACQLRLQISNSSPNATASKLQACIANCIVWEACRNATRRCRAQSGRLLSYSIEGYSPVSRSPLLSDCARYLCGSFPGRLQPELHSGLSADRDGSRVIGPRLPVFSATAAGGGRLPPPAAAPGCRRSCRLLPPVPDSSAATKTVADGAMG